MSTWVVWKKPGIFHCASLSPETLRNPSIDDRARDVRLVGRKPDILILFTLSSYTVVSECYLTGL